MAAACGEASAPTPPEDPFSAVEASQHSERANLTKITELVARALDDPGLRQRIRNDMRNSPFLEHKLEFSTYIRGASGGILLSKMAKAANMPPGCHEN